MLDKLKRRWKALVEKEPGRRFRDRYERAHAKRRSIWHRGLYMGGGVIIFAAGLFFLPAPGPGMVIIFVGLGMIAQESLMVAKALDKTEVWLRRKLRPLRARWRGASDSVRRWIIAAALAAVAGAAWFSYNFVLG